MSNPFGAENRNRLINEYFSELDVATITYDDIHKHIYRLLLWTDQSIGLAHCYESDKCQPGKPWYGRSLAFHAWISNELEEEPSQVGEKIDWLFLRAVDDLVEAILQRRTKSEHIARKQWQPYEHESFPRPGRDPEMIKIIREDLAPYFNIPVPEDVMERLAQRLRKYVSTENKRRNLLGEGFEDVLSHVLNRAIKSESINIRARVILHELPGFHRHRQGGKPNKVDLAVISAERRILITAKWSVRADREKQFSTDFTDYVSAESAGRPFEYVFITNEFDPARLMRACEKLAVNSPMFTHVVHVNTDGLRAAYKGSRTETIEKVENYIETKRLMGISEWLREIEKR